MNVYLICLFWFIGMIIVIIMDYIIYLYKKLKLQEFLRKTPYYSGEIYFSKNEKINYEIPEKEIYDLQTELDEL